jgi:hypothetical protein
MNFTVFLKNGTRHSNVPFKDLKAMILAQEVSKISGDSDVVFKIFEMFPEHFEEVAEGTLLAATK